MQDGQISKAMSDQVIKRREFHMKSSSTFEEPEQSLKDVVLKGGNNAVNIKIKVLFASL